MVTIDHGRDEAGRQTTTRFLHLDESHVSGGERVARGDLIGDLGRTGLLAGGIPHLHFEVHRTGPQGRPGPVNPHLYWTDGVGVVTCFDKARRWAVDGLRMTYPVPCRDVPWR